MTEDQIWPLLRHRNVLLVLDMLSMENTAVKLYFTPILPNAPDESIIDDQFRFNANGLIKLKIWRKDIL